MKKLISILLLTILLAAYINAQTINTEQDLRDCSQFLDQSISEKRAADVRIKFLELLLEARADQLQTAKELAAERLITIQSKDKIIERLEAIKCSTTTYLFVYKKKSCY